MADNFQRFSKGLSTVCATAMLLIASYAAAQGIRGEHPETYVVQRGDTLWDISGRFLQKPWLWPEIWQANPQIHNPHLIYPGDVISLAYLDRVQSLAVTPGPRSPEEAATPITALPLADVEAFLRDLRIVEDFDSLPHVVGLEDDRLRGAQGHVAYVRGLDDVQAGERYTVLRAGNRYTRLERNNCCDLLDSRDLDFRGRHLADSAQFWTHVLTPGSSEVLGHELTRVGSGTITRGEVGGLDVSTMLLDESGHEVRIGDRLVPVDAIAYDLLFFPHPPAGQTEYGHIRVLAVADTYAYGGPRDVIAISAGTREGVDNGTVFSIWREGSEVVDRVRAGAFRDIDTTRPNSRNRAQLPDEYAAHALVFRTYEKVSYALVMDSVKPTRVGYHLKHPDATY